MKPIQKEEVFKLLCSASMQGTLGLFAGSGLTKALLQNTQVYKAYSWQELLEKCCEEMDIETDILKDKGSYPEIASKICKRYSVNNKKDFKVSVSVLKRTIAKLVTAYPSAETKEQYSKYFEKLNFNWVVTTNYDTMIESLIPESALSLCPEDSFKKTINLTPVYHIHGVKSNPESIIITNEDYVSLFRPNDYRQSRLPFLFKESTVLMVGYAFGDINVISAVDWSKNVYTNLIEENSSSIIQLLYTKTPQKEPYYDSDGIIIYETKSIESFFKELFASLDKFNMEHSDEVEKVKSKMSYLNTKTDKIFSNFIDNKDDRIQIIEFIGNLPTEYNYIYTSFTKFIREVMLYNINPLDFNPSFESIKIQLEILLDIIQYINYKNMTIDFFQLVADHLESLSFYIGNSNGKAHDAYDMWKERKKDIPSITLDELNKYAAVKQGGHTHLKGLLEIE
ncbi:SIR2 family protein [Paludicola sp. MB14-C6]|uniref:SIR2 family protein n=1 Tax=Paludihabitans sp. MB14-C6 TaxID=3070656 RepID=UPI0027DE4445|nr:SIR2 family protein [Paludicola sp. MB14-C6]WMJ23443.1 SIR2 family protein [Paludicola sp. MB14-C6]